MNTLFFFVLLGFTGVVLCLRCHVTSDEKALHCGDATNMTCTSAGYAPYCDKNPGDDSHMNGVCTCDKFCLTQADCHSGCPGPFTSECAPAYDNAFITLCRCRSHK